MGAIISSPSASIRRQKIVEVAENLCRQISSLFSSTKKKIKNAGNTALSAIRNIDVDILKEALEIFHNWFTWFLGSIFALKFTDTGRAFYSANNSVMKAMFLIKFISFLTTLLATLSQMHKKSIAPLLLILAFESATSVLAASMISTPSLWISLVSWLCIFVLFGSCSYSELKEQTLQMKRWFWNPNPQAPSPPSVWHSCFC